MAKIMLFGSSSVFDIPQEISRWIFEYNKQGHSFIVGDRKGADSAFHKALCANGVASQNVEIYCMDSVKNNVYDYPVRVYTTEYDASNKITTIKLGDSIEHTIEDIEKEIDIRFNREWYEFRDRQLIKDCNAAICIWDKQSKGTMHMAQLLSIYNKPCYMFTV